MAPSHFAHWLTCRICLTSVLALALQFISFRFRASASRRSLCNSCCCCCSCACCCCCCCCWYCCCTTCCAAATCCRWWCSWLSLISWNTPCEWTANYIDTLGDGRYGHVSVVCLWYLRYRLQAHLNGKSNRIQEERATMQQKNYRQDNKVFAIVTSPHHRTNWEPF